MIEAIAWQSAILFWVALCVFRVGAMQKNITMGWRQWAEMAQAALIVVLLFWFMSDGRGCSLYGGGLDVGFAHQLAGLA